MSTLRAKVIKYTVLPGFIPRVADIFTSGFMHIAYLLAVVYEGLNLLPKNHPYLNSQNKGRYGIRHVIGEASNHLVFDKDNIDKIIIFFITLSGLFILFSQFALLILALFMNQEVFAQTGNDLFNYKTLFSVDSSLGHEGNAAQDIAFILLDRVFGVEGIFKSCISTNDTCQSLTGGNITVATGAFPSAFHTALHQLFHFYSMGMFLIAVIVILYFIVAVVAETAASGTPFGQRTNKIWAPVRLILFVAMLVPISFGTAEGLNAAQYITLWTAKIGSNFATNGWGFFNERLDQGQLIDLDKLLAQPDITGINDILTFMYVLKTCKVVEEHAEKYNIPIKIEPYIVSNSGSVPMPFMATDYLNAADSSDGKQIRVVFGYYGDTENITDQDHVKKINQLTADYTKRVRPTCGELNIDISVSHEYDTGILNPVFYYLIQDMWADTEMTNNALCRVNHKYAGITDCILPKDTDFALERQNQHKQEFKNSAETQLSLLSFFVEDNPQNSMTASLRSKGWAGAALWYNRIAELNGAVHSALQNAPKIVLYPEVMKLIRDQQIARNENLSIDKSFEPKLPDGEKIIYNFGEKERKIAVVLYSAFSIWKPSATENNIESSGNILINAINKILGTSGIYNMRSNMDIHPLAQLSALGKSMMEATIRNMAIGAASMFAQELDVKESDAVRLAGVLWGLGLATLILSMILFYILPILPFVYFIFAVSGWVKSIFEAMVAMPLWAMAHIRIDGEGIPGRDASNGYFLLLEIFLRPILIVFGLLSSFIIFSSMVEVLNNIFDIVVNNIGQTPTQGQVSDLEVFKNTIRGPVDNLFYTAVYVIVVYMLALANFKLIDAIPNKIMRWAGSSVSTFQESAGDPASQITGSIFTGGTLLTQRINGGTLTAMLG